MPGLWLSLTGSLTQLDFRPHGRPQEELTPPVSDVPRGATLISTAFKSLLKRPFFNRLVEDSLPRKNYRWVRDILRGGLAVGGVRGLEVATHTVAGLEAMGVIVARGVSEAVVGMAPPLAFVRQGGMDQAGNGEELPGRRTCRVHSQS